MENESLEITVKPRKIWKALLLSVLAVGLGQIYNGQLKKLWIVFIGLIIIPLFFAVTDLLITFYGYIALAVFLISIQLCIIIDACLSAKSQKEYVPKKYNRRYFYFIYIVLVYIVFFCFFKTPYGFICNYVIVFKSPIESSEPTLKEGDNIIANMRAYKNIDPDYGDIVIFNMDNFNYMFRVVGKPNDILSIIDNSLIINNKHVRNSFIKTKVIGNFQVNEYEEQLPNGCKYSIYKYANILNYRTIDIDSVIIPKDCYFLLGDNRNNAMDSRYFGVIKREQIIGKATCILYGKSFDRMNINLNVN